MEQATVEKLRALNRDFYRRVAPEFSKSRESLQPGLLRVLDLWPPPSRLLDLGCGDGRFGDALRSRAPGATYLGVDESRELMGQRDRADALDLEFQDLLSLPWPVHWSSPPFDAVVCFSVLHHIPGVELRRRFLAKLRACLADRGRWAVSVWQVLHRERFLRRRVPWSEIGVADEVVDDGDLLLDWQRGERALRYVHHFEEQELRGLLEEAGLTVDEVWRSDGDSGDLGLYFVGR